MNYAADTGIPLSLNRFGISPAINLYSFSLQEVREDLESKLLVAKHAADARQTQVRVVVSIWG
jgi:hypothetical protein